MHVVQIMSTAHEYCDVVNFASNCSGNDESGRFNLKSEDQKLVVYSSINTYFDSSSGSVTLNNHFIKQAKRNTG